MSTLLRGNNREVLSETTITWNGVKQFDHVHFQFVEGRPILIHIDNSDMAENLVATFEYNTSGTTYVQWFDGSGSEIKFTVVASTDRVYGPIEGFPRFLGGMLKLTCAGVPADTKVTKVSAREM